MRYPIIDDHDESPTQVTHAAFHGEHRSWRDRGA
jgi:hypothetical protein